MDGVTLLLLCGVLALVLNLLGRVRKVHRYWEERGVPSPKTDFLLGNFTTNLMGRESMGEMYTRFYREFKGEPMVGLYSLLRPVLLVRDPELVEEVLMKNFSHFTDRGLDFDVKARTIDNNLFTMKGEHWRAMRYKLSPAFTSGKMKNMFAEAHKCAERMIEYIEKKGAGEMDLKDLLPLYTCDLIASCGFGIDLGNELHSDSQFVKNAKRVFYLGPWKLFKFLLLQTFPGAKRFINVTMTTPELGGYFGGLIGQVIERRKGDVDARKDFIQLLLQLKDRESIKLQPKEIEEVNGALPVENHPPNQIDLTNELLVAQAYAFLTAGFDTTSMTLQYAMVLLANNPEAQEKARQEVLTVLQEEGSLTYQALNRMTYLENCIKESLRIYPVISFLPRDCTKEFVFPNGLRLEPGIFVAFSIYGLQNDPEYFPEPDKFRPERFEREPVKGTYFPFGAGPRQCIGMRFAHVNMRLGLAEILRKYRIEPSSKTQMPIVFEPSNFVNTSIGPIWCKLIKI